jgi:signal transduction histidine kinase
VTLRTRLFTTGLLVALPLAIVLAVIEQRFRLADMRSTLQTQVSVELEGGLRERCERDPARVDRPGLGPPSDPLGRGPGGRGRGGLPPSPGGRGGPRGPRGPRLFAYDRDGGAASPGAPPFSDETTFWSGGGIGVQLTAPLGGEGKCALLLAQLPPMEGQLRDQIFALALLVISIVAAAWFAARPVIAALRRLGDDVGRSAATQYAQPVAVGGDVEVAALARAFNDAGARVRAHLVEAQARERTLREFVADTSHDIAIPLTVLQGQLADLERTDPRVRASITEVHYMSSLLRNLATATKLGETSVPLSRAGVELNALVERVVARHQPIARARQVALDFGVPGSATMIHTDVTLLEQALSNLVDNAVRHNRSGGHAAVVLAADARTFTITVTDDGPGVGDAELPRLTERWYRSDAARTRRPDGHGLGLAITVGALDRLGYRLSLSRPVGGGLCAEISGTLDA